MGQLAISNSDCVKNHKFKQVVSNKYKEDDNVFASSVRKLGMNNFADFLRDDWTANTARKMGFTNFADWVDNVDKKDDSFFSDFARTVVKHPVLTIATVVGSIFIGKKLIKTIKDRNLQGITKDVSEKIKIPPKTNIATVSTKATPELVQSIKPKTIAEQVEQANQIIAKGLDYERNLGFKNLDIFKGLTDSERRKILTYYSATKREKELLLFASGNKPATIEVLKCYTSDIFDCLRKNNVDVVELFTKDSGNLLMNKVKVEPIIASNKEFFIKRLGLSANASIKDIYNTLNKSTASVLDNPNAFSDIKCLLQGNTTKNAYLSQLLQDINNNERNLRRSVGMVSFHQKSAAGIESYKQALKDALKLKNSAYVDMPETLKQEITNIIDSITNEQYLNRLEATNDLFKDAVFKENQFKALQNLANKLEFVMKTGGNITFD